VNLAYDVHVLRMVQCRIEDRRICVHVALFLRNGGDTPDLPIIVESSQKGLSDYQGMSGSQNSTARKGCNVGYPLNRQKDDQFVRSRCAVGQS
jgi:hypothetical protein